MADQKISQLSDGGTSQATDEYVIARSGANYRIDGASIAAAATSVGTLSSLTVSGDITASAGSSTDPSITFSGYTNWGFGIDGTGLRMVAGGAGTTTTFTTTGLTTNNAVVSGDLTVDTNTLYVDAANNRVGIGTTSPAYALSVTGAVEVRNANALHLRDAGNTNFASLFNASGAMVFETNYAEKMRLDASGNLGLGVTPSAWASNWEAMQFAFGTGLASAAGGDFNVVNNAIFDSTDNRWEYHTSTVGVSRYRQNFGTHEWYTAPSGTAGNAITFTQAMTLDASGNLLVGTSSQIYPTSGRVNVEVNGTSQALFGLGVGGTAAAYILHDGTNASIWQSRNGYMRFATNDAERARITAGGYFKASDDGTYSGSTASYHEFRSSGTASDWTVYISNKNATAANVYGVLIGYSNATPNGTGNEFLLCNDATATRAIIRSNGGLANYQSNNVDLSDARTKTDISPAASMWGKVAALEIVSYKYIDQTHDDVNLGVIAQQVETVEPVWVDADGFGETPEGEEPLKTVYTKDITFAAIKALQEAMARIESLEARLAALES